MNRFLQAAVVALAVTLAPGAFAVDDSAVTHAGRGTVKSVDVAQRSLRMEHEPIPSLKWPAMTMNFKARDAEMLKGLEPGSRVDFELMQVDGKWQVVKISPAD